MTDREIMQPAPPPECYTVEEKTAYAFGWWKAMEAQRLAQPEQPARAYEMALRQWDHWKQYALELQEKLVKYEGGAPMVLNTSPPQREWVDLTPKEIEACRQKGYVNGGLNAPFDFDKAAGAVLAKAKEKNT